MLVLFNYIFIIDNKKKHNYYYGKEDEDYMMMMMNYIVNDTGPIGGKAIAKEIYRYTVVNHCDEIIIEQKTTPGEPNN